MNGPRRSIQLLSVLSTFMLVTIMVPSHAQELIDTSDSMNRITLDFENLRDSEQVTDQFANFGVIFEGATVVGQGDSLNHAQFPPRSGVNVVLDDLQHSGRITVRFDPQVAQDVRVVGAYVTGNRNVTMTAYDGEDNVLGTVATGGANQLPNGVPNQLLEINAAQPIRTVVFFNGGERGHTYTLDDFYFDTGLVCSIVGVPLYKQGGSEEWADDLYGGSVASPWPDPEGPGQLARFRHWGSATTSAAMVASYFGDLQGKDSVTPGELNKWLRENGGYSGGVLWFPKVAEYARNVKGIALYNYTGRGPDDGIVNVYVCNDATIILQTFSNPYSDGHFVVGTGIADDTRWKVNDPGDYNISTLGADAYVSYRKYSSTPTELRHLAMAIHPPDTPSSLNSAMPATDVSVSITVVDPAGRALEFDAITGTYESQILDGLFYGEGFGPNDGSERNTEALIFATGAPFSGEYHVRIVSHVSGNYEVDVLGYDADGRSGSVGTQGFAAAGSEILLTIRYSGSDSEELGITAFWPTDMQTPTPTVTTLAPGATPTATSADTTQTPTPTVTTLAPGATPTPTPSSDQLGGESVSVRLYLPIVNN